MSREFQVGDRVKTGPYIGTVTSVDPPNVTHTNIRRVGFLRDNAVRDEDPWSVRLDSCTPFHEGFQVGDRVRHSAKGFDGTVAAEQGGQYELRELSDGSPAYYANPFLITLIRPASERPPQVGDVYRWTDHRGDVSDVHLLRENEGSFTVSEDGGGSEYFVQTWAVKRRIAEGAFRLKTPGKGSVEQEAAGRSAPTASEPLYTEPAPAFEVGGVVCYVAYDEPAVIERVVGDLVYYEGLLFNSRAALLNAITEGRATYTPPGKSTGRTLLRDIEKLDYLQDFFRALHAPPKVCADCGKGPAVAMGTPEERVHLCVYCERRHFPRTMRESLPSAVAALPDKPGPNEGACAWASADYESDW